MKKTIVAALILGGVATVCLEPPNDKEMDYKYEFSEHKALKLPEDDPRIMSADEIEQQYSTQGWTPTIKDYYQNN